MDDGNCEKGCSDGTGSIHTISLMLVIAPDSPSSSNLVLPLAAGDLFQANLMPLLPPYLYSIQIREVLLTVGVSLQISPKKDRRMKKIDRQRKDKQDREEYKERATAHTVTIAIVSVNLNQSPSPSTSSAGIFPLLLGNLFIYSSFPIPPRGMTVM